MWTATADDATPVAPPAAAADDDAEVPPVASGASVATPTFAEVYREHVAFVWQVLRRLGVAPADLPDACQEVFLTVHRRLPEFEHRSSLRTWLYGIAVRCASAQRRRARRSPETPSTTAPEPTVDAAQSESMARRQARALVDEILDELDDDKRAVFVLYELEELTMAEAAAALGCPLQTAYSRLHAARKTFEAALRRRRAREGKP
ncbi:MAG TPA: sigma-70 family RNA polymerase sigma factor [Kofleriaceae bacterium]|nr:sigma-70 family RNA polymerase sigma factor [Kofleriaceae bacterium]